MPKKTYVTVTETEYPTECPVCGSEINENDMYYEFPEPVGAMCQDCVANYEQTAIADD